MKGKRATDEKVKGEKILTATKGVIIKPSSNSFKLYTKLLPTLPDVINQSFMIYSFRDAPA